MADVSEKFIYKLKRSLHGVDELVFTLPCAKDKDLYADLSVKVRSIIMEMARNNKQADAKIDEAVKLSLEEEKAQMEALFRIAILSHQSYKEIRNIFRKLFSNSQSCTTPNGKFIDENIWLEMDPRDEEKALVGYCANFINL